MKAELSPARTTSVEPGTIGQRKWILAERTQRRTTILKSMAKPVKNCCANARRRADDPGSTKNLVDRDFPPGLQLKL
jgi:hypothetical protein